MKPGYLYAYPYRDGYLAYKVFAVTLTETFSVIHITLFAAFFDKPEEVDITSETPLLMEHIPIKNEFLAGGSLPVKELPIYSHEEQIYKNWLREWNEERAPVYAITVEELIRELVSSGE
jgi:hypothetical protein